MNETEKADIDEIINVLALIKVRYVVF